VRLDDVDVRSSQSTGGERGADHALLRRAVGRGEAVGRAVGVDRGAADHGEHLVPVALRVRQLFQHQHADAFGPAGAVGGVGERLAAAVGRKPALPAELQQRPRRRHHVHARGQRQRALPRPQRLGGEVHRDQRRRARRVDRDDRAFEAEGVGHPAGQRARRDAGADRTVGVGQRADHQVGVVLPVGPGEDAGPAAAQPPRVDPGPLDRLPGHLQQQPLLRVQRHRLARRDPEEARVEVGDAVEEPAGLADAHAPLVDPGAGDRLDVPAAVGRERPDRVAAVLEEPPQRFGAADAAGEPAAHGHDGDRFRGGGPQLLVLPLEPLGLLHRGTECFDDPVARGGHVSAP
jgi:hypothetical protein